MNLSYLNRVRQLGTSTLYYGYTVDLTAGGIPTLLGKRVNECADMSGTLSTAANNAIVVGDFSQYVIVDRVGMSVEPIPHLFSTANNLPSGQRGLYCYWRTGAGTTNDLAFRILQTD
jgi:HK97 family phage major capsid protein